MLCRFPPNRDELRAAIVIHERHALALIRERGTAYFAGVVRKTAILAQILARGRIGQGEDRRSCQHHRRHRGHREHQQYAPQVGTSFVLATPMGWIAPTLFGILHAEEGEVYRTFVLRPMGGRLAQKKEKTEDRVRRSGGRVVG